MDVVTIEEKIVLWHKHNEDSRRLSEVPGIGSLTATVLVKPIGDVKNFKSVRQVVSWLGLVPREHSNGSKKMC